jgi:aryl-alcohol dehydrogenase-like predicted oxidoreductase
MEYRQFGRTDIEVSTIGFGCWEISGTYGAIDAGEFERAVKRALDVGINCFDTAEAYGMGISEQALGRALGTRRADVCLVTKVGVGYPEAPNRRDSSRARIMFGPEHFPRNLQAVEELKALAARYGKTLPQFALRWMLSQPAIHTGLVGFRRPEEVEENLGALGFTISKQDMAAIDAIFARNGAVTEPPGWLEDDPID